MYDEIKNKAIIAALNLAEYPNAEQVYKKLDCWSFPHEITMPLMDILQTVVNRPVLLKRPQRIYHNGRERYEYCDISKSGYRAYSILVGWLYDLEQEYGLDNISMVIETLDDIIDSENYPCKS